MTLRPLILTSTHARHTYFACKLGEVFDISAIVREKKVFEPRTVARDPRERLILEQWFDARDRAEQQYFGNASLPNVPTLGVNGGQVNSAEVLDFIDAYKPNIGLVFGTSLLGSELIHALQGNFINLHLGLSPYYRGSGTNFWPFYDRMPEYVGATLHWIDLGADSGPILAQGRPEIEELDSPHSVGCKAILVGTGLMCEVAKNFPHSSDPGAVQNAQNNIRLCKRKDFNAEAVEKVMGYIEDGLLKNYALKGPKPVDLVRGRERKPLR